MFMLLFWRSKSHLFRSLFFVTLASLTQQPSALSLQWDRQMQPSGRAGWVRLPRYCILHKLSMFPLWHPALLCEFLQYIPRTLFIFMSFVYISSLGQSVPPYEYEWSGPVVKGPVRVLSLTARQTTVTVFHLSQQTRANLSSLITGWGRHLI